jgi:hypothetical protein
MTDEKLVPLTEADLVMNITIQMAAMRARKEAGRNVDSEFFAKRLVERLLMGGLPPFKVVHESGKDWFDPPGSKQGE